jgi:hypothetical protein
MCFLQSCTFVAAQHYQTRPGIAYGLYIDTNNITTRYCDNRRERERERERERGREKLYYI